MKRTQEVDSFSEHGPPTVPYYCRRLLPEPLPEFRENWSLSQLNAPYPCPPLPSPPRELLLSRDCLSLSLPYPRLRSRSLEYEGLLALDRDGFSAAVCAGGDMELRREPPVYPPRLRIAFSRSSFSLGLRNDLSPRDRLLGVGSLENAMKPLGPAEAARDCAAVGGCC